MRIKYVLICAIVGLGGAALAFAQSVPRPPSPQSGTLRVSTRAVQVNVIVQDKNGQPVKGLTKKDFTILDHWQPQTVASMWEQTNEVTTSTAAASAPNTFSNRFQQGSDVSPVVSVILLDALNTPPRDRASAREQVIKFLKQLQPQDRVVLYFLSDKIYIAHEFTSDTASLLRALGVFSHLPQDGAGQAPPMDFAPDSPSTGGMAEGASSWAKAGVVADQVFDIEAKVRDTSAALTVIANHLAGVPGRKNLIWISDSFPFQINMGSVGQHGAYGPEVFKEAITKATNALSNANVAIYPVDARGLAAKRPGQYEIDVRNATIVLAADTGGRSFYDTNDIAGAIQQSIDDSRVTYVLSYYPSHNQWNGEFREITVKVNRPGVKVRARAVYFASPDNVVSAKDKEEIMVDAAKDSLESTALAMDVQADPVIANGDRHIVARVKIDPSQLRLEKIGDHWTDSVDVKWVQLADDGQVLASTSQTLNLNIPQSDYETFFRKAASFSGSVNLVKGATEVRLVARDSGNGSVGTVNISVDRLFKTDAAK
ncbi:MAG TPA: VWA domain-containing protein [Candidatus Acidoferrales bacterium]